MTWIRKMTENGLDYKNPTGAEAYAVFKNLRIIERNTSEGSRAPEKVSFPRLNWDLPDSNPSLHSRSRIKKGRVLMMISALKSSQHSTIRNGIRLTWSFLVLLEITSMNWTHVQSSFLWVLLRDGIRWKKASYVILVRIPKMCAAPRDVDMKLNREIDIQSLNNTKKSIPKKEDIKEMMKDPTLIVFPNLRLLLQIALTLPVISNLTPAVRRKGGYWQGLSCSWGRWEAEW